VAKTTEFKGVIQRLPFVAGILGFHEQPGQLSCAPDLAVINPVDMSQKKTIGKWVGMVPMGKTDRNFLFTYAWGGCIAAARSARRLSRRHSGPGRWPRTDARAGSPGP
jgi:hypothetical protein